MSEPASEVRPSAPHDGALSALACGNVVLVAVPDSAERAEQLAPTLRPELPAEPVGCHRRQAKRPGGEPPAGQSRRHDAGNEEDFTAALGFEVPGIRAMTTLGETSMASLREVSALFIEPGVRVVR